MPKCRKKTKKYCQSFRISMALIDRQVEYILSDHIFIVHSVLWNDCCVLWCDALDFEWDSSSIEGHRHPSVAMKFIPNGRIYLLVQNSRIFTFWEDTMWIPNTLKCIWNISVVSFDVMHQWWYNFGWKSFLSHSEKNLQHLTRTRVEFKAFVFPILRRHY